MHRAIAILGWMVLMPVATLVMAEGKTASAVYAHQVLALTMPYVAERSGKAELTAEVLSPEDLVLGKTVRRERVERGQATWNTRIALAETMPVEELIWHRLRFTLRYAGENRAAVEEIQSISEILRRPVMRIRAQRSYMTGARAAMRVIVTSAAHDGAVEAITGGAVQIELLKTDHGPQLLFAGQLDRNGSVDADFQFPEGLTGSFPVRFTAETPLGTVNTTETVQLEERISVLLTTEKPVYQPSQTIHLRALALDRGDHHAAMERNLTFEVEDPRGNKVFRKVTKTDKFGVASAKFTLADEVNLGAYHATAKLGDVNSNHAELTVNVERYVLPKFRVAIEFAKTGAREKRDYRPGDHVVGMVRANYFFGEPVTNASVTLKASAMDVELFQAVTAEGRTDENGNYRFDLRLPNFFAGKQSGAAPVVMEATVKDATDHEEMREEPITVSRLPLLIAAIPESGALVRGMKNEVYVLVSYPDGTPAKADVVLRGDDSLERINGGPWTEQTTTDEAGIGVVHVEGNVNSTLRIEADDRKGNKAVDTVELQTRAGEDQLLLRTSRAVYKPGDRMSLTVMSTRQRGAVYVDVVRDGQTIVTRDADLADGRAS